MLFIRSLIASGVILVASCNGSEERSGQPADDTAAKITALADTYVKEYFEMFPTQALGSGSRDLYPDRLPDNGPEAVKRWQGREDSILASLRQYRLAAIEGKPEELTYKFLQNQLESAQTFRLCRMELWNVSPTYTSWQADLSVVAGLQATETVEDQKNAIARFSQLGKYLDKEIENLREGIRLGFTAPKNNVRVVISQMDAMIAAPLADSPFVRMAKPNATEFRKDLEGLERKTIRPAIARYRDFLRNTYLAAAREPVGVSANPNGDSCYTAAVSFYSTVGMTPQQVHELGRSQMEKIQAEMRQIGERSFRVSDPARLLALLKSEPQHRFKSRDELIQYAEAAVERARLALPKWFGRLPQAKVVVEPYPSYLEKSAPGGQSVPPTADGQPGKYLINAYNATEQSRAGLESTAFHEAYPGHHLQGSIALERSDLHSISRYFYLSGFGEGWALYSERLSDEMQLFSSDVDRLGLLSNEALRAARLVVDSGMHALGWTRQQAIDYLLANTTETPAHAAAEIDRYIAVPGQATSYMIGSIEIRKLREEAERAFGSDFNIRDFHDRVLEDGAMPLWVLREKITRWIKENGEKN